VTRVVAGTAGGRRLDVPPGNGTRPTSELVREALFSTLDAARGGLAGARVLDLYAGSGAVGIEARSRGAAMALLVEANRGAVQVARRNARTLDLDAVLVNAERVEWLARRPNPHPEPFDVAFLDPPYDVTDDVLRAVLTGLRDNGWLADDALVVVERSSRTGGFEWPAAFTADKARHYGETVLWYGRAAEDQGDL
jgi:16S rRNA (guanine966-N2)-methyltransferase